MDIDFSSIETYLKKVTDAISRGEYRIEINAKRKANRDLFQDYVINEEKAREILLSLKVTDFSDILQNDHPGFEYETLYVFGKNIELLERYGTTKKNVSLYIKINLLKDDFVIVISFHEQRFPLKYYFRQR